jgi:hypothetical protein
LAHGVGSNLADRLCRDGHHALPMLLLLNPAMTDMPARQIVDKGEDGGRGKD